MTYQKCKMKTILLPYCLQHELPHDNTNKMTCAPSEDSDQPGHLPSLIRVFAVRSMGSEGPKVSSGGQGRLWSDWADAQADLSLPWEHSSFCWFCCSAAQWKMLQFLKGIFKSQYKSQHRNKSTYLDRQLWANSVDPSGSTLFTQ